MAKDRKCSSSCIPSRACTTSRRRGHIKAFHLTQDLLLIIYTQQQRNPRRIQPNPSSFESHTTSKCQPISRYASNLPNRPNRHSCDSWPAGIRSLSGWMCFVRDGQLLYGGLLMWSNFRSHCSRLDTCLQCSTGSMLCGLRRCCLDFNSIE
jgi:hypothetical protein